MRVPRLARRTRAGTLSALTSSTIGAPARPARAPPAQDEADSDTFARVFSGNAQLRGLDAPWASVYGCHVYGTWCGQLGDGRAVSLGEVTVSTDEERDGGSSGGDGDGGVYELQLKGSGRTPFSRSFDGRAVVRSCVREFLASEAMAALRVPTTRALCVVETGEVARRAWYASEPSPINAGAKAAEAAGGPLGALKRRAQRAGGGGSDGGADASGAWRPAAPRKYRPDTRVEERCAVRCRASRSFVRFGQLELFALREAAQGSTRELRELARFAARREFAAEVDVDADGWVGELADAAARAQARLITEWLRVGYVQGNMNSDNALVGGRTLDYGPFAFMEAYDPEFQPFTSDPEGKFAYARQPQAAFVNVQTLAAALAVLEGEDHGPQAAEALQASAREAYAVEFEAQWLEVRRRKLGLSPGHHGVDDLYGRLSTLMQRSRADFTMAFRLLAVAADGFSDEDADAGLRALAPAFGVGAAGASGATEIGGEGDEVGGSDGRAGGDGDAGRGGLPCGELLRSWRTWMLDYQRAVARDAHPSREEEMRLANPKYILRNWMATQAYDRAAAGDYSLVDELSALLERPYDDGTSEQEARYFRPTPDWAYGRAGVAFLS